MVYRMGGRSSWWKESQEDRQAEMARRGLDWMELLRKPTGSPSGIASTSRQDSRAYALLTR